MKIEELLEELTPDVCFLPGYAEVHVTSVDGQDTAKASYKDASVLEALLAALLALKQQLVERRKC